PPERGAEDPRAALALGHVAHCTRNRYYALLHPLDPDLDRAATRRVARRPASARRERRIVNEKLDELKRRLGEVMDISRASSYLDWDQQVLMPAGAAGLRAEESATLDRLAHERFTAPELGQLLEDLRGYEDSLDPDSDEASLIRVTRRDWEKASKVPSELRGEIAHAASTALPVWVEARKNSDFKSFLPYLEHNLELTRRYIECFDGAD